MLFWAVRLGRALYPRWGKSLIVGLITAMWIGAAALCGRLSSNWHRQFSDHYDRFFGTRVFRWLAAIDSSATRICALNHRCYPFYGSSRQYRVCQPMWVPSRAWLLGYLSDRGITVIASRSAEDTGPFGWPTYPRLNKWFAEHPEVFRPVYKCSEFHVYEVNSLHRSDRGGHPNERAP
jgi:hypothetical protein